MAATAREPNGRRRGRMLRCAMATAIVGLGLAAAGGARAQAVPNGAAPTPAATAARLLGVHDERPAPAVGGTVPRGAGGMAPSAPKPAPAATPSRPPLRTDPRRTEAGLAADRLAQSGERSPRPTASIAPGTRFGPRLGGRVNPRATSRLAVRQTDGAGTRFGGTDTPSPEAFRSDPRDGFSPRP